MWDGPRSAITPIAFWGARQHGIVRWPTQRADADDGMGGWLGCKRNATKGAQYSVIDKPQPRGQSR